MELYGHLSRPNTAQLEHETEGPAGGAGAQRKPYSLAYSGTTWKCGDTYSEARIY